MDASTVRRVSTERRTKGGKCEKPGSRAKEGEAEGRDTSKLEESPDLQRFETLNRKGYVNPKKLMVQKREQKAYKLFNSRLENGTLRAPQLHAVCFSARSSSSTSMYYHGTGSSQSSDVLRSSREHAAATFAHPSSNKYQCPHHHGAFGTVGGTAPVSSLLGGGPDRYEEVKHPSKSGRPSSALEAPFEPKSGSGKAATLIGETSYKKQKV